MGSSFQIEPEPVPTDLFDFRRYQVCSRTTAIYPGKDESFVYPAFGLMGELGEFIEKLKKEMRDKNNTNGHLISSEIKAKLRKELGDMLWYWAQLCTELYFDCEEVAVENLHKLQGRMERGTLQGSGDDR